MCETLTLAWVSGNKRQLYSSPKFDAMTTEGGMVSMTRMEHASSL